MTASLPAAVVQRAESLAQELGCPVAVLLDFATFARKPPRSRASGSPTAKPAKPKAKALTLAQLKAAVLERFECKTLKDLGQSDLFRMAIAGMEFPALSKAKRDDWLKVYRKYIALPENERQEVGPTCINGIDVTKNFRPWQVFGLDPKTASNDDINAAFRQLAKQYHPDQGGDRLVFEQLKLMRDSLLAFR